MMGTSAVHEALPGAPHAVRSVSGCREARALPRLRPSERDADLASNRHRDRGRAAARPGCPSFDLLRGIHHQRDHGRHSGHCRRHRRRQHGGSVGGRVCDSSAGRAAVRMLDRVPTIFRFVALMAPTAAMSATIGVTRSPSPAMRRGATTFDLADLVDGRPLGRACWSSRSFSRGSAAGRAGDDVSAGRDRDAVRTRLRVRGHHVRRRRTVARSHASRISDDPAARLGLVPFRAALRVARHCDNCDALRPGERFAGRVRLRRRRRTRRS